MMIFLHSVTRLSFFAEAGSDRLGEERRKEAYRTHTTYIIPCTYLSHGLHLTRCHKPAGKPIAIERFDILFSLHPAAESLAYFRVRLSYDYHMTIIRLSYDYHTYTNFQWRRCTYNYFYVSGCRQPYQGSKHSGRRTFF